MKKKKRRSKFVVAVTALKDSEFELLYSVMNTYSVKEIVQMASRMVNDQNGIVSGCLEYEYNRRNSCAIELFDYTGYLID